METATAEPKSLKIVREPKVYLVGRQVTDEATLAKFLADEQVTWQTDTEVGAERLAEVAGRVCYMSYGKGRKTNKEFIGHIIEVGHGSVLEHGVWNFLVTGVSRSFTHELIRHRHFSYSQLSQRYVDESDSDYIEPDVIANDPELHRLWTEAVNAARHAARSVLPNATETKIFFTGNARALRHFIELRGSEHAEVEIRKVAVQVLKLMQKEAPNVFGDYTLEPLADGTFATRTPHVKV